MSAVTPRAEDLRALQRDFAAHIRDPERRPGPPDVEDRRMAIYRELIFNNVDSLLATGFPVLRRLYSDPAWQALVRDFLVHHRCETPLFAEVGQELIGYLQDEREPGPEDPPFLLELAHYEWVELALTVAEEDIDLADVDPNGDLLEGVPVLSPLAWPLAYRWPVHLIDADHRPAEPPGQPTYIVVYRDRNDEVQFLLLNPVTHRLLTLLDGEEPISGRRALETIAAELAHPDPGVVIAGGLQALEDLRGHGVVLGTAREP